MGMNIYAQMPATNHCDCCGRQDEGERLHVGKSSAGWCFALHVMPERGIYDLPDWMPIFDTAALVTEYGEAMSKDEVLKYITERRGKYAWDHPFTSPFYRSEAQPHAENHSERGPHGLLRHRVGMYCRSHGAGTWDCIEGDFS